MVSEPRFIDTPQVLFAFRITLPADEVESSIKTILLKIGWIDLSSSDFTPYPRCYSSLTFTSFESSLLSVFYESRTLEGWTISLPES